MNWLKSIMDPNKVKVTARSDVWNSCFSPVRCWRWRITVTLTNTSTELVLIAPESSWCGLFSSLTSSGFFQEQLNFSWDHVTLCMILVQTKSRFWSYSGRIRSESNSFWVNSIGHKQKAYMDFWMDDEEYLQMRRPSHIRTFFGHAGHNEIHVFHKVLGVNARSTKLRSLQRSSSKKVRFYISVTVTTWQTDPSLYSECIL